MYLGIQALMPREVRDVDERVVARIRELGFTGVACRFFRPLETSMEEVDRLRGVLEAGGVAPAQANALYPDLVHPDDTQRRQGVKAMQQMCKIARRLGADNLYVRPGSLNPAGSWYPHPENRHPRTRQRLVASLKEVAAAAEYEGVRLAIEGHVLSPLFNAQVTREVIEAVGSKALGFNMDPVNFVGSLPEAYDTTSLVNHLFDVLGPYTICGHAKDFFLQDRLVLHVEETIIGRGLMDQATFLKRFEQCCPQGYLLIEHLRDDQVPEAKANLDKVANQVGIAWGQRK